MYIAICLIMKRSVIMKRGCLDKCHANLNFKLCKMWSTHKNNPQLEQIFQESYREGIWSQPITPINPSIIHSFTHLSYNSTFFPLTYHLMYHSFHYSTYPSTCWSIIHFPSYALIPATQSLAHSPVYPFPHPFIYPWIPLTHLTHYIHSFPSISPLFIQKHFLSIWPCTRSYGHWNVWATLWATQKFIIYLIT